MQSTSTKLRVMAETLETAEPLLRNSSRFQRLLDFRDDVPLERAVALEAELAELFLETLGPARALEAALYAGARFRGGLLDAWGLAVLSSPTFGSAIQVGSKYLPASALNLRSRFTITENDTAMSVWDSRPLGPQRDVIAAFDLASGWQFMCSLIREPLRPTSVILGLPRIDDRELLVRIFGKEPEFQTSRNSIFVFSTSYLSAPLPLSDPNVSAAHARICEELLGADSPERPIAAAVRGYLVRAIYRNPGLREASKALNTSERTLRRRLVTEGTDFRNIVTEVKSSVARELLINTTLSSAQIAERVGYSEASNFSNAFKRWTGMSPREFRSVHQRESLT